MSTKSLTNYLHHGYCISQDAAGTWSIYDPATETSIDGIRSSQRAENIVDARRIRTHYRRHLTKQALPDRNLVTALAEGQALYLEVNQVTGLCKPL